MPEWRCAVVLPNSLAAFVSRGPVPGLVGVEVGIGGIVEVRGKNLEWVQQQLANFLATIVIKGNDYTMCATLERGNEPGSRSGFDVIVTSQAGVVIPRKLYKPIIVAVK